MYEGCSEIIEILAVNNFFLKSYNFHFWSICCKEYLLLECKLFNVSDIYVRHDIYRKFTSTPAPLAQRHSDEMYIWALDLKCTTDAQTSVISFNFLNWTNIYSFYLLCFVRCRISMPYYFTLFLIIRCEPLHNMCSTFDATSSWIFSAPPTHLYILCVDVSFENSICYLYKRAMDT